MTRGAAPPTSRSVRPGIPGVVFMTHAVNAVAVAADPARDRIYAAIAGPGAYGGELVTLTSSTGVVLHRLALGESLALAEINADASRLWAVSRDPATLFSVDLTGAEPGLERVLPLPTFDNFDPNWPMDLAVGSGTLDTVAVALWGASGTSGGVLLYTDGVLRDRAPLPADGLEKGPFGLFFAGGPEHAGTNLLRVEDRHLNVLGKVTERARSLRYQDGYLIAQTSEGAELLDVSNPRAPVRLGTLPLAGTMLLDVPNRLIWALDIGPGGNGAELVRRDLDTLTIAATTQLRGFASGYPRDLVRTRSGRFAFVASSFDATTLVLFAPPN